MDVNTTGLDRTGDVGLPNVEWTIGPNFISSTSSWRRATVSINSASGSRVGTESSFLSGSLFRKSRSGRIVSPILVTVYLNSGVPGSVTQEQTDRVLVSPAVLWRPVGAGPFPDTSGWALQTCPDHLRILPVVPGPR